MNSSQPSSPHQKPMIREDETCLFTFVDHPCDRATSGQGKWRPCDRDITFGFTVITGVRILLVRKRIITQGDHSPNRYIQSSQFLFPLHKNRGFEQRKRPASEDRSFMKLHNLRQGNHLPMCLFNTYGIELLLRKFFLSRLCEQITSHTADT